MLRSPVVLPVLRLQCSAARFQHRLVTHVTAVLGHDEEQCRRMRNGTWAGLLLEYMLTCGHHAHNMLTLLKLEWLDTHVQTVCTSVDIGCLRTNIHRGWRAHYSV